MEPSRAAGLLSPLALLLALPVSAAAQSARPATGPALPPRTFDPPRRYELLRIEPPATHPLAPTWATSVNEAGLVVGRFQTGGVYHAFVWSESGGTVELAGTAGASATVATCIDRSGRVAGTSDSPVMWTAGGQLVPLPPLPGVLSSGASALANGRVVGGAQVSTFPGDYVAWVWDSLDGTRALPDLGFDFASTAYDVNAHGQIAGGVGIRRAARFDLATSESLVLGTFGGEHSEALGIDAHGHLVGWAMEPAFRTLPFLWTPEGGLQYLGSLTGNFADGRAQALDSAHRVVGATTIGSTQVAFVWTPEDGMRALGTLVDALGDFELGQANDIAESGWIVGAGTDASTGAVLGYALRPRW